jgi:hypothetical protein
MMSFIVPALILAAVAAALFFALAETLPPMQPAETDGVYQFAQVYWREVAQARDWVGLKAQLRRWQQLANPGWDEAQVDEIAHALNAAVFRFAEPAPARS